MYLRFSHMRLTQRSTKLCYQTRTNLWQWAWLTQSHKQKWQHRLKGENALARLPRNVRQRFRYQWNLHQQVRNYYPNGAWRNPLYGELHLPVLLYRLGYIASFFQGRMWLQTHHWTLNGQSTRHVGYRVKPGDWWGCSQMSYADPRRVPAYGEWIYPFFGYLRWPRWSDLATPVPLPWVFWKETCTSASCTV